MENQNKIWMVSLLLSAVAGYCDTVTFVSAGSIFSAHVTGNFIVFAYQLIKGSELQAWVKLLTFPVFIISVIVGGRIALKTANPYKLLLVEGMILLLSGLVSVVFLRIPGLNWLSYVVVMMAVFAMGLQNAFGKLYAKETFGPTTMMTGNVTQASLDLGSSIASAFNDNLSKESLRKQGVIIGGFLLGCLAGALTAKMFGLSVLLLPGIGLIVCYLSNGSSK
ncbi:YoaK family protein [Mucilaginibacter terrae]|uniref:Uncharacterized membrane protein YoaK (UPF0700 family) n=1 Tax=Mucilaginibacter terrae TaxID=1955052 RepID=A0ABU3GU25_9SPHI|nr:YoaK family protein [Mucilaginibacter terrae]MDT3402140.1 uncharacterized membrane protein YoaK (UPF0700 family) [Mucilaginibacter terrae]